MEELEETVERFKGGTLSHETAQVNELPNPVAQYDIDHPPYSTPTPLNINESPLGEVEEEREVGSGDAVSNESEQPDEAMEVEQRENVTPEVDWAESGGQWRPIVLTDGEGDPKEVPVESEDIEKEQETPTTHAEEQEDEEPEVNEKEAARERARKGKEKAPPLVKKEETSYNATKEESGWSDDPGAYKRGTEGCD